jgi:hypothetical protein
MLNEEEVLSSASSLLSKLRFRPLFTSAYLQFPLTLGFMRMISEPMTKLSALTTLLPN